MKGEARMEMSRVKSVTKADDDPSLLPMVVVSSIGTAYLII